MSQAHRPSPKQVVCPQCGRSAGVEKVSAIYLAGIGVKRAANQPGENLPEQVLQRLPGLSRQDLSALSRKLAPPSSGKGLPTRPIHPDIVVLVFTCVIPFFISGIANQQRGALIPALVVLALAYGLYFYRRTAITAKFVQTQATQKEKQQRIERGVQEWMKLYYCSEDEGVFLPGKKELVPVEEMTNYLFEK